MDSLKRLDTGEIADLVQSVLPNQILIAIEPDEKSGILLIDGNLQARVQAERDRYVYRLRTRPGPGSSQLDQGSAPALLEAVADAFDLLRKRKETTHAHAPQHEQGHESGGS